MKTAHVLLALLAASSLAGCADPYVNGPFMIGATPSPEQAARDRARVYEEGVPLETEASLPPPPGRRIAEPGVTRLPPAARSAW